MAWLYLIAAGVFEWGWPVGLKLGWTDKGAHIGWIIFAIATMAASGTLLLIAQRTIPMGTAYAVRRAVHACKVLLCGADCGGYSGSEAGFSPLKRETPG